MEYKKIKTSPPNQSRQKSDMFVRTNLNYLLSMCLRERAAENSKILAEQKYLQLLKFNFDEEKY